MLQVITVIIVLSAFFVFPKQALSSLFDCSKGLAVRTFSPQEFIMEGDTYSVRNFGDSVYLDLKTGLKCRVYSSETGIVYFQTREQWDGAYTSWALQEDSSFKRYDGARIIADFDINTEDIGNKLLTVYIKIVDDKNLFVVKDTFSYIFSIKDLRSV